MHAIENGKMCDKLYHTTKADGKEGTYFETTNTEGGGAKWEREGKSALKMNKTG